jgi:hypothetical protein
MNYKSSYRQGSCRENSQESRKNKIKNIGGVFIKTYGSEGSNFSSCFLQIRNINIHFEIW